MRRISYRHWLLQSFLAAGVIPLLICVCLILGLFQTSVERYARGVGQRRLEAMEHDLGFFAQLCETTLQHVAEDPLIARTVQQGTQRDTEVYALLYRAVNSLTPEAGLSLYDAGGRMLYTTADGRPGETLPVHWGLLGAAGESAGTVFRRVSPYDDAAERSCIQIARPVRAGAETVGYAVIDVAERQLSALFEGWNGEGEYLLLDRFWEEIVCSPALQGEETAAALRAALLATGGAGTTDRDAWLLTAREEHSGFTLILQQRRPLAGETQRLLHGVALGSIALSILLCFWFAMRMSRRVSEPVRDLNAAMRQVEAGDFGVRAEVRGNDELAQLSGRFNRMTQRLEQNLDDSLRQQRELGDARMRMMQAQLNPHFLYNTLDTLKWLGKIHKVPEVSTISSDLADILRRSISADTLVPLRTALETLDRYIEIQSIRFPGKFEYRAEAEEAALDCLIPKLMLQPLVENAVVHGFEDGSSGEIVVSARTEGEDLVIDVKDSGCGMSEESRRRFLAAKAPGAQPEQGHLGLYNVDAILRLVYGPEHDLQLIDDLPRGTHLRAVLPAAPVKGEEAEHEEGRGG